ncbi:MAG: TatD family hydrolase [Desulfuromonadales bacterium]|nr:TatD family hydrolase [Desulfuromonadales bacterium]
MVELFDTHIHLDRLPGDDLANEIEQARQQGIYSFLIPGIAPANWDTLTNLAGEHAGLFLAPGVHPLAAESWSPQVEERLVQLLAHPAVVAIGEIGLDSKLPVPLGLQEQVCRAQLRLSVAAGRPVLLHCRGLLTRCLEIFQEEQGPRVGGILHAFSGSVEVAKVALRLNLSLGFGGGITWPEARRAPEVLRTLPATAFVLESDAPDQSPEPYRHERNRPQWLTLTARRCAELRQCSLEEVAAQTTTNARRILNLPSS